MSLTAPAPTFLFPPEGSAHLQMYVLGADFNLDHTCPRQEIIKPLNPPANAGDTRDAGLIPGLGRYPLEEGMATHSSILAWKIPWPEEPGDL